MKSFADLVTVIHELRQRCPWDREQTVNTMQPHIREEVEELMEALDAADWPHAAEEFGDALFNLLMTINILEETGYLTLEQVLTGVREKMIRRHPHVYGDVVANTPEEALKAFHEAKGREKE